MDLTERRKRVVITGVGPVTPIGIGKEAFGESLIRGKTSFKRVEFPNRDMAQYRCQIGAPIESFDFNAYAERTRHSKYFGRTSQFAIVAALLALKDAGIELEKGKDESSEGSGPYALKGMDSFQTGVILGIGAEAMDLLEHYHERFLSRGPRGISPFALPNVYMSSITSHVAEYFTLRGTSFAVSTACASATHAMVNSFIQIRDGIEDIMVTGGADACLTPYVFAGFDVIRAMPAFRSREGWVCHGRGIRSARL